MDAGAPKSI
jgi:hypothetical protein